MPEHLDSRDHVEPLEPLELLVRLDAEQQIRALKTRYFRYVDSNLWPSLRCLFTDDAEVFMPETWPAPKTADEAVASFSRALGVRDSVHRGYQPDITVTSSTTAHGRWVMDDRLYRKGTAESVGDSRLIYGSGVYDETYRREPGGWKIASLLLTRNRVDGFAVLE